jgi:hypothetical protein
MKRMYRAQILLEPEQHRELSRIARREGRSISEIARRLIRVGLASQNADPLLKSRRAAVLERLRALRRDIQGKTGIIERDLIHEIREERTADLLPGNH